MLNADLPKVGNQVNTTINGTSSVDSDFNTQFRTLVFNNNQNNNNNGKYFMNAVVNYVNRFEPKYRTMFVTNATDGVTWVKV
ncbi:hemagglutinin, partial [Mycoplasmopsis synoviae]